MKRIQITALILFIQTLLWVVLMLLSTRDIEAGWQLPDYLSWSAEAGLLYHLNYINVSLLTLVVVLFYGLLYTFLKGESPEWALTALLFVPVYGLLNLVSYSLQIHSVPELARSVLQGEGNPELAAQLIQANPASLVGYINGLAYAVLGLPSVIFGLLLRRKQKKVSGSLLLLNGVFCILGLTGYLLGNALLGAGTMIGGVVFLLALAAVFMEFRKDR